MIRNSLLFFIFSLSISSFLFAQSPFVDKGFAIIYSTKDYNAALEIAIDANEKLGIDLDLRGYYKNEDGGLKTDSICGCGQLHEYVARGRWDDGIYISIEFSDRYEGFEKGYYVVMTVSAPTDGDDLDQMVSKAKEYYSDAYVKNTSVFIGCMH